MKEKGFHKAVTIFIDILGTHGRKEFDEWYNITEIFNNTVKKEKLFDSNHTESSYKREVHVFSDCAYIIYDYKDGVKEDIKNINALITIACYNTEKVLYKFLESGFIVRGGLTYGDIYYENDIWFGPAMNKACDLESNDAIYPRVIIDPEYADEAVEYNESNYRDRSDKCNINGQIIKKDNDGIYYIHYLNSMELGVNQIDKDFLPNQLLELWNRKENELDENEKAKESIKKKYDWLKEYIINSKCKKERIEYNDIINPDSEYMKERAKEEMELMQNLKNKYI